VFHQLEVDYDYNFVLLGIGCHERDYRLCWLMNKCFNFNLEREESILCEEDGPEYPLFRSYHDGPYACSVIKNRVDGGILMPELKQVDYFFCSDQSLQLPEDFVKNLRQLSLIFAVFELSADNLPSRQNLILE
jgi:hypothetical protein